MQYVEQVVKRKSGFYELTCPTGTPTSVWFLRLRSTGTGPQLVILTWNLLLMEGG